MKNGRWPQKKWKWKTTSVLRQSYWADLTTKTSKTNVFDTIEIDLVKDHFDQSPAHLWFWYHLIIFLFNDQPQGIFQWIYNWIKKIVGYNFVKMFEDHLQSHFSTQGTSSTFSWSDGLSQQVLIPPLKLLDFGHNPQSKYLFVSRVSTAVLGNSKKI